ncbi:hypothetical protein [Histidinibacterium lentulum]|uniref:Uncharacterized protein n=1 Tax=Histidinibacterium lentulum TaxID=2480588 RepID=A0A3N2R7T9_9RHOB|nr:hypothetical protein [Histidinibacterium lentulum]ROU03562.1 hypothetical protein EAT49_04510 [Histidinibacterium lentulum]
MLIPAGLLLTTVAGCAAPPQNPDPNGTGAPLIARATDSAIVNRDTLNDKIPAIAVTPDGCQNWILDDGAEGYAVERFDPVAGTVVCTNRLPPGAVIGNPYTNRFPDILP